MAINSDIKILLKNLTQICSNAGIGLNKFLNEKIFEIEERERIKTTVSKSWYSSHAEIDFKRYLSKILHREISEVELQKYKGLMERKIYSNGRSGKEIDDLYTKRELLKDANSRCVYCGKPLSTETIQIDHKIPVAEGGDNLITNLQATCRRCNSGKKDYLSIASPRIWYERTKELLDNTVKMTNTKRFCVLIKNNSKCSKCQRSSRDVELFVKPIVPKKNGGQLIYDNLIAICEYCRREEKDE